MYSQQGPPSAPSQPLTSPLPQPGTPSNLPISASQSSPGSFGGSFSQSSSTQPQSQSVPKEVALNLASLCKVGQDTVQDIVFRAQEIFQLLRTVQVSLISTKALKLVMANLELYNVLLLMNLLLLSKFFFQKKSRLKSK